MWNEMWNEMCSIFFLTFPNSSMSFSRRKKEWNTLIGRGLLRYCIGRDHNMTTPAHLCHTAPTDWCPQHVVILGEFIAAIEWPPLQCGAEYVIKTCLETLYECSYQACSLHLTRNKYGTLLFGQSVGQNKVTPDIPLLWQYLDVRSVSCYIINKNINQRVATQSASIIIIIVS